MKPLAAVPVLLTLAAACATAHAQEPVLSVAQAVEEALLRNDRLAAQRDVVTQADLGVLLARSTFQPKVTPNILGSFGQTDISSQTYRLDLSQRFSTGTEIRLGAGAASAQIPAPAGTPGGDIRFYNTDTTLSVSQPLLRGFGRDVARRALTSAELRRQDAARDRTLVEQQVAIDVAGAYYRVVAQASAVDVTRQGLDRARRLRDASEAKLDAGLVSQLDVLRAQQLVAQAETGYFDALAAIDDARDQLHFLLGRDSAAGPVAVERAVPRVDDAPVDVAAAVQVALARRLDLQNRTAEAADADRQVRVARNQLLPQVDVNLALTRRETASRLSRSFGVDGYEVATFFTVAMPGDRTVSRIEHQQALIDRERRRRDLATLERQIADDVRRTVRERDRALRAIAAAETAVDLSRREVEVAELRFARGLSNNLDVVTAESGRLAAETRLLQALAEAAVVRLRLRAVVGMFDPRTDVATTGPLELPAPGHP